MLGIDLHRNRGIAHCSALDITIGILSRAPTAVLFHQADITQVQRRLGRKAMGRAALVKIWSRSSRLALPIRPLVLFTATGMVIFRFQLIVIPDTIAIHIGVLRVNTGIGGTDIWRCRKVDKNCQPAFAGLIGNGPCRVKISVLILLSKRPWLRKTSSPLFTAITMRYALPGTMLLGACSQAAAVSAG